MSQVDANAEFLIQLDDWWAQLWVMRIGTTPPADTVKFNFFTFVKMACSEVDDWRLQDTTLSALFSQFIEEQNNVR
tara:strand:- start:4 stop:231 length:228 start_codon:yes stop_codon:yes gene_type:complete